MTPIYLDYNATTPIAGEVALAMKPYLEEYFGNPSSLHSFGAKARLAVENARCQVAALLNCHPDEIIFTSGGSESNNFAIKGAAWAYRHKGNHIITSAVEHPAVLEVCKFLQKQGFQLTILPVDEFGMVDVLSVEKAITPQTILLSIMHANNEVGTIQPIKAISEIARRHGILFHSDAAQSVGKIPVDVQALNVDLLSVAGHKLYAPKGVGALFIRRGIQLEKLIHGANHEQNLRAGTENVAEIVGLGKACEIAMRDLENNSVHFCRMRDRLYRGIKNRVGTVRLNGHPEMRLPNTLSLSFPSMEANTLLSELTDIAASAGAACHSEDVSVSSVLQAMKIPIEYAMGTIRFSTGRMTTETEIDTAVEMITKTVERLMPSLSEKDDSDMISCENVKLTQFTHGLGCGCKLGKKELEKILIQLPQANHPDVLVNASTSDDAAVYRITNEVAIVQTVDFFTPLVDDAYHFGAIAAANALSDIYAMGARPLFALNIACFPSKRLPLEILQQILKGAGDKAAEAGIGILGGHTIEDNEPKFGMVVTGSINPEKILTNSNARVGDLLILTKPIGTGIIATATKHGLASADITGRAIGIMSELNKNAAEVMAQFQVNACTDISGFGLLGHLLEMTRASETDAELYLNAVPFIKGVEALVVNQSVSGGTLSNKEYVAPFVEWNSVPEITRILLCDAQTSGGLLISIPEAQAENLLKNLHDKGITQAAIIGKIFRKGNGAIKLSLK